MECRADQARGADRFANASALCAGKGRWVGSEVARLDFDSVVSDAVCGPAGILESGSLKRTAADGKPPSMRRQKRSWDGLKEFAT
jgi:hypothetical protein